MASQPAARPIGLDEPAGATGQPNACLSAEWALARACAATTVEASTAERIRALLGSRPDWARLLELAANHNVLALVAARLCTDFRQDCPAAVIEQLHAFLRANAVHNARLARHLVDLVELLGVHGVRAIAYKGPVLASMAYRNLALRTFCDLDLIVSRWDYHLRVDAVLNAHGWRLVSDQGYEKTFTSADGRVQLDLHHALAPPARMPVRLDFERLWARREVVCMPGGQVPGLSPADALVALCIQLAKDMAEQRRPPALIKVCDIAESMRSSLQPRWADVACVARGLGVLRIVHVSLLAARELLGTALPAAVDEALRARPKLATLAAHACQRILAGPDSDSSMRYSCPELLDAARWHAALRERARSALLAALVYRVLLPNAQDYAWVDLPRALDGLYWLVRPLRLLARQGGRATRRLRLRAHD